MRFAAPILALLISAHSASATQAQVEGLESISSYTQGIQALSDHLPELAVQRFQQAYAVKDLTDAQNREILYRLTEAQVRANQPEKALITLRSKFFKDHPEREFWIAQAYAAQGKYSEAIKHFKMLDANSSYLDDATLSLASLQMALQQKAEAIQNYLKASQSKNKATRIKASTALTEIYLTDNNLDQAKSQLQRIPQGDKSDLLKRVLEAKLSTKENKHQDAIEQFTSLFESEQQLPPRLYQIALIGLADARYAAGLQLEATQGLTHFVRNHQDSPLLLPIFERLSAWAPSPLQANDPFYLLLEKWANRDTENPSILSYQLGGNFIVNPVPPARAISSTSDELNALALYYYAKHTAQLDSAGSLAKAQFLFGSFRLIYPNHPLFGASYLETAHLQLQAEHKKGAQDTLRTLIQLAKQKQVTLANHTRSKAGFLAGLLSVETEDYTEALSAFAEAATSHNKELAQAATINLGLAALRDSDLVAFDAQTNKILDSTLLTQLSLERALWLAHQKHEEAREALSNFLFKHPNHERAVDARIALANICATQPPLDPILSKALIDTVDTTTLTSVQRHEFTRAHYHLAELQQDWPTAIETLEAFIQQSKENNRSIDLSEFTMRQGLALYRNGEHNKARQLLGKLATEHPQSPLVPFCHYYAAMAARLEGTPQALKKSVDIFEKVITSKSPLATEARIQQARILLDINRTEEAKISLNKVYKAKSSSAQQREIGILLATALHTQGSELPGQYSKAIAIYDQLLSHPKLPLSWSNQLHYMKGQTLESMGDKKAALDCYYRVINRENITENSPQSQQEWQWFYKCGFKAIALLEANEQFRAAVSVAKKVASYQGPESEAYQKRARSLEMKHMIWEE